VFFQLLLWQGRVLGAQYTAMDHHEDESNSKQDDEV